MALALLIILYLLLAIVAVLILALVMPLRIELVVTKNDAWHLSGALRPFGRFGPRIAMSKDVDVVEATPKAKPEKRKKRGGWKRKPQRIVSSAVQLVRDIIHCIRLNAATCDLTFGLGDPCDTGQAFGFMTPLIYGTSASDRVCLNVVPDFDRAVFTGRMAVDFSFVPVALLAPVARFGWSTMGPRR